ncbi:hypothetical protein CYY_001338 [Polysphondylium violaceum]|uniref:Thioredoxin domain-containing protein n=1 Tax=Polysphondylium violaceum TaxID=133409 RepID=A0A8J4Q249_9MYCE|nr:hypothetical protein CYY_001338 [Polysphondylium violaceum]
MFANKSLFTIVIFIAILQFSQVNSTTIEIPSATGWPLLRSSSAFETIYNRNDNQLIVIYFTKDNCPPCNVCAPLIGPLILNSTYANVQFFEINFSHFLNIPTDYEVLEVTSLPSVKFYRNYEATENGYIKFLWKSAAPMVMAQDTKKFLEANYNL